MLRRLTWCVVAGIWLTIGMYGGAVAQTAPFLDPPFPGTQTLSGMMSSPYGPRNPGGKGTIFHKGIDYNPLPGDADQGRLIPASFIDGWFVQALTHMSGAGWVMEVNQKANSKGEQLQLFHLLRNSIKTAVNGIDVSGAIVYRVAWKTALKVKKEDGTNVSCPFLIFLNTAETAVEHAYTLSQCAGKEAAYPTKAKKIKFVATNKIDASKFPYVAPMGNSGTDKVHLHIARNMENDNPLQIVKHDTEPDYEIAMLKSALVAGKKEDQKVLVSVGYLPKLDLNEVTVEVPEGWAGQKVNTWNFAGRSDETFEKNPSGTALNPKTDITKEQCSDATVVSTKPLICTKAWPKTNVETPPPLKRVLVFYVPIDITKVCTGDYPVQVTARSVDAFTLKIATFPVHVTGKCTLPPPPVGTLRVEGDALKYSGPLFTQAAATGPFKRFVIIDGPRCPAKDTQCFSAVGVVAPGGADRVMVATVGATFATFIVKGPPVQPGVTPNRIRISYGFLGPQGLTKTYQLDCGVDDLKPCNVPGMHLDVAGKKVQLNGVTLSASDGTTTKLTGTLSFEGFEVITVPPSIP